MNKPLRVPFWSFIAYLAAFAAVLLVLGLGFGLWALAPIPGALILGLVAFRLRWVRYQMHLSDRL